MEWLKYFSSEPIASIAFVVLVLFKTIELFVNHYPIRNNFKTRLNRLERSMLAATVYNEHLPLKDRMEALYDYMYLGGNSSTRDYGLTQVVIKDTTMWRSICHKKFEKQKDYDPKKVFEDNMKHIKESIR